MAKFECVQSVTAVHILDSELLMTVQFCVSCYIFVLLHYIFVDCFCTTENDEDWFLSVIITTYFNNKDLRNWRSNYIFL